jgi:hypothetical protein
MTDTRGGVELTAEAEARLGEYLAGVRTALAGSPDVSPDEIEADVREHVENELRSAPRPVGLAALEAVLGRLGPPDQWASGERPSVLARAGHWLREGWRGLRAKLGDRWRSGRAAVVRGPEDWRLAYLAFGVFAVGALTVVIFPVALLVSYLLARAGVAAAREAGGELGAARKWLLYPPLVLVSTALMIPVVLWPVALGGWAGSEVAGAAHRVELFDRPDPKPATTRDVLPRWDWEAREAWRQRVAKQVEEDRKLLAKIPVRTEWAPVAAGLFVGVGAVSLWWLVLGAAGATWPQAVRATFFPLADRFRPAHGWAVAVACLAVLVGWVVAAREVASAAGVW